MLLIWNRPTNVQIFFVLVIQSQKWPFCLSVSWCFFLSLHICFYWNFPLLPPCSSPLVSTASLKLNPRIQQMTLGAIYGLHQELNAFLYPIVMSIDVQPNWPFHHCNILTYKIVIRFVLVNLYKFTCWSIWKWNQELERKHAYSNSSSLAACYGGIKVLIRDKLPGRSSIPVLSLFLDV